MSNPDNKKKYWRIPVTWEECGIVYVEKDEKMNSLQKAFDFVSEHLDDIEMKNVLDKEYVDSSFRLTHNEVEEIEVYQ